MFLLGFLESEFRTPKFAKIGLQAFQIQVLPAQSGAKWPEKQDSDVKSCSTCRKNTNMDVEFFSKLCTKTKICASRAGINFEVIRSYANQFRGSQIEHCGHTIAGPDLEVDD